MRVPTIDIVPIGARQNTTTHGLRSQNYNDLQKSLSGEVSVNEHIESILDAPISSEELNDTLLRGKTAN